MLHQTGLLSPEAPSVGSIPAGRLALRELLARFARPWHRGAVMGVCAAVFPGEIAGMGKSGWDLWLGVTHSFGSVWPHRGVVVVGVRLQ